MLQLHQKAIHHHLQISTKKRKDVSFFFLFFFLCFFALFRSFALCFFYNKVLTTKKCIQQVLHLNPHSCCSKAPLKKKKRISTSFLSFSPKALPFCFQFLICHSNVFLFFLFFTATNTKHQRKKRRFENSTWKKKSTKSDPNRPFLLKIRSEILNKPPNF
jgi:hypothetical protein